MKYVTKSREVEVYHFSPPDGPGPYFWPAWLRKAKDDGVCPTFNFDNWVVLDRGDLKVYTDEEFEENFTGYDPHPCVDGQEHNWCEHYGSCKNCGLSREKPVPPDLVIRNVDGKEEVHVLRKPIDIPPVPKKVLGEQSENWFARVHDWLVECREEMQKP